MPELKLQICCTFLCENLNCLFLDAESFHFFTSSLITFKTLASSVIG